MAKAAKRSKKRFGGVLNPFLLVHLDYFEKPGVELVRIQACSLLKYYRHIYEDLEKLLVGCAFLEVVERTLTPGQESSQMFHLLKEALEILEDQSEVGCLLWAFVVKCVTLLGLQPQFTVCIHCRRPIHSSGMFGFSVPQGGVVCGACIGRGTATHRASAETLRVLEKMLAESLQTASAFGLSESRKRELERVLVPFVGHHVGREFCSFRVLNDVMTRTKAARRT